MIYKVPSNLPTGLLRSPGGALADELAQPFIDKLRRRNRYRTPTTTVTIGTEIDVVPITSEDRPALEVYRTRTTDTGRATVTGLADTEPNADVAPIMSVAINSRRVFEGRVQSAHLTSDGVLTATAVDPKRQLKSATYSGSYTDASVGSIVKDVLKSVPVKHDIEDGFFAIDELEPGGEEIESGYRAIVDEEGTDAESGETATTSGSDGPGDADRDYPTLTRDFSDATVAQVLEDLSKVANAEWWIDANRHVHFGAAFPAKRWWINGVLDSRAGDHTAPVRKIVVIGGSAGETGDRRRPRASKNRLRGVAGDEDAPPAKTYRYTEPSATTQAIVDNIAEVLWREQQRQMSSGTIKHSGRAAPRPLDKIQLPPYIDGKDRPYTVRSVRHRITSDEGYITMLTLGGDPKRQFGTSGSDGQNRSASEEASGATGFGDGATDSEAQPYPDIPGGGAH